ncbi:hypothetical protein GPJ56_006821 [Histomonas meleagridis]|uniref:uncharacterized protein n=1 Tax=Histomonas meleagridis TaxID=135588 RepID=UPI003559B80B|nr:hypothetical protein GPJ56_006821 [Histomonas meleagridis]KAH0800228.1 hypothetical protein GO595_007340 [Histomonas meleagridis]
MSTLITIHLHDLDSNCIDLTVSALDPVKILEEYLTEIDASHNRYFVYNGTLLMGSFTFSFFKIGDGSHIRTVIMKKHIKAPSAQSYFDHNFKMKHRNLKQSRPITPTYRVQENMVNELMDNIPRRSTIIEAARLLDLSNLRNEISGKVTDIFETTDKNLDHRQNIMNATIFKQSRVKTTENHSAPSSEVLPMIW